MYWSAGGFAIVKLREVGSTDLMDTEGTSAGLTKLVSMVLFASVVTAILSEYGESDVAFTALTR